MWLRKNRKNRLFRLFNRDHIAGDDDAADRQTGPMGRLCGACVLFPFFAGIKLAVAFRLSSYGFNQGSSNKYLQSSAKRLYLGCVIPLPFSYTERDGLSFAKVLKIRICVVPPVSLGSR